VRRAGLPSELADSVEAGGSDGDQAMPYLQLDVPNHYPIEVKRGLARHLGEKYARIMQVEQMTAFIKQAPRTWYEILQHFAGQPYTPVYRAFGKLRPKLGRRVDLVPAFPYTFADTEFVQGDGRPE
jgi:hypothetical protein